MSNIIYRMSPIMTDNPFSRESLQLIIARLKEENTALRAHINDLTRQLNNYAKTTRDTQSYYQRIYHEQQSLIEQQKKEITTLCEEARFSDQIIDSLRQEVKTLNNMIETLCRREMEERTNKEASESKKQPNKPDVE